MEEGDNFKEENISVTEDAADLSVEKNTTETIKEHTGHELWKPGESGNPYGRKKDTPAQIFEKRAIKAIVKEYRQALADALPKISPVLIDKAVSGELPAIKEVNDRVMGKARETIGLDGGEDKPIPILMLNIKDLPAKEENIEE